MILLALGMNNQPFCPHWAMLLRDQGAPVHLQEISPVQGIRAKYFNI
jgi:hypothetical protein